MTDQKSVYSLLCSSLRGVQADTVEINSKSSLHLVLGLPFSHYRERVIMLLISGV